MNTAPENNPLRDINNARNMGRTHDVTISGFDLGRIEAEARGWRAAKAAERKRTQEMAMLRDALDKIANSETTGDLGKDCWCMREIARLALDTLSNEKLSDSRPKI